MTPEDEVLARCLQSLAADVTAHTAVPPAHPIWLRAQRERRRLAIDRAVRPLRFIEGITFFSALLLAAWVLRQSSPGVLSRATLELAALAVVIVLSGCAVLLHLARNHPSHS